MRALLRKPLLVDEGMDRVLVNRHKEWLGLWFSHHAGWELHVDPEACRLVKRPGNTLDDSRPCCDPGAKNTPLTRRAYVFLCLILSILVREGRQLTLQRIADTLAGIGRSDSVFLENEMSLELDRRETRRDLVHALRVLHDWRVLFAVERDDDAYVSSGKGDVLYNVNRPVLSRLLAARQPPSLVRSTDPDERMHEIWQGQASLSASESEDWRLREMRCGLFRRLLDDPVLYYEDLNDAEQEYLVKQRSRMVREVENATGLVGEIRAEGIAMVDRIGDLSDYSLPETGTDGHLTLLLATFLAKRLRNGDSDPVLIFELESETRRLAEVHSTWRKDARIPGSEAVLTREALARLRALGLVRLISAPEPAVVVLPAIGRFGLREPKDKKIVLQEDFF
ncbi:MAG: TIGR02678 family protein [Verrucomicrobiales bacterium]|nr:TIGR02678 family protein [Verrucomicrobiales bacterium]